MASGWDWCSTTSNEGKQWYKRWLFLNWFYIYLFAERKHSKATSVSLVIFLSWLCSLLLPMELGWRTEYVHLALHFSTITFGTQQISSDGSHLMDVAGPLGCINFTLTSYSSPALWMVNPSHHLPSYTQLTYCPTWMSCCEACGGSETKNVSSPDTWLILRLLYPWSRNHWLSLVPGMVLATLNCGSSSFLVTLLCPLTQRRTLRSWCGCCTTDTAFLGWGFGHSQGSEDLFGRPGVC